MHINKHTLEGICHASIKQSKYLKFRVSIFSMIRLQEKNTPKIAGYKAKDSCIFWYLKLLVKYLEIFGSYPPRPDQKNKQKQAPCKVGPKTS